MNRTLALCLMGSVAVGGVAAVATVVAGGGWIVGLLAYSAAGSGALVGSTLLARPGRGRSGVPEPEPKPEAEKPAADKGALALG